MLRILFICNLLLLLHIPLTCESKKLYGYKSMKKIPKSEVEVKTYLFPCAIDDELYFNTTYAKNHKHVYNCKKKLVIRMTVNSGGEYCSKSDGFVPIDHVIDGMTGRKKRLLYPLMVRIKREKMYQLYDMQLVKTINAEAKEEVINYENTANFSGCDTSSSHPTCGFSFFNNKIIQFSEGFCCSCDQSKNDQRQPCESHHSEGNNLQEMARYGVQHRRNNRSSKDLEAEERNMDLLTRNTGSYQEMPLESNKNMMQNSQTEVQNLESGNNYLENNVDEEVQGESADSEVISDDLSPIRQSRANSEANKPVSGSMRANNISVKTFNFEFSLDPKNENDLCTASNVDIVIEGEDEFPNDTHKYNSDSNNNFSQKYNTSPNNSLSQQYAGLNNSSLKKNNNGTNNSLSQKMLKILMINKIKVDKKKEKFASTKKPYSLSYVTRLPVKEKYSNQINMNNTKPENHNKSKFSIKLEATENELSIKIDNKKPEEIEECKSFINESSGITNHDLLLKTQVKNTTKQPKSSLGPQKPTLDQFRSVKITKNINKTQTVEYTSKRSINTSSTLGFKINETNKTSTSKDFMRNITTKPTTSENTTITKENCVKLENIGNTNNTNFSSIENFVYKLVPVINTVYSNSDFKNNEKTNAIITDLENITHNLNIDLKKNCNSTQLSLAAVSVFQNNSDLMPLNSTFVLSKTVPVKENKQLKENVGEVTSFAEDSSRLNMLHFRGSFPNQKEQLHPSGIKKREACDRQIRGGQSCSTEKELPCNANPDTYFESAHCLRFSDLWYNVQRLVNPRMENALTVKVYAKHRTADRRICWENLTKRLPGRIGTVNEIVTDGSNIVIFYSSDDKVAFSLDCGSDYVLVPQPLPKRCKDPELKSLSYGGPAEYLVLKENEISFDGEDCDKAGVTYGAFARQTHRCQHSAGSCLKNQPLQFWRDDKKAIEKGDQGQYFLSNFLKVTDQSILQNTSSNEVVLRAPYFEKYQSHVVVELNADHIDIIADKNEGQITEVYIDATSDKVTVIKIVVTNLGIAADLFGVDFANCSSSLGHSDFDRPGKDEIPPQHRITYTVTVTTPLSHKEIVCKVVLYNIDQDIVAVREITIVRGHRCMCVWYCKCVCYNHPSPGLPCHPLTIKEYNRAGFPGQLPVATGTDCSTLFMVLQGLLWLFLFLILFGLIKALLGLCFTEIGVWGLWYILPDEARSLCYYIEPKLACYRIVFDCEGFPIHPHTYRRSVHFLPWYSEFSVNTFFFICASRTCLCDNLSRKASSMMFLHQQYQPCCSPASRVRASCSPRFTRKSPCASSCSNRRKFRLAAGGEGNIMEHGSHNYADAENAKRFVDQLLRSYIVYRNLSRPIGGVHSVPGTPYCIRGFFLENDNGFYEFSPPSPLMQIWQMDNTALEPPIMLDPIPFRVIYRSAQQVLAARELSASPRGVVINAP